MSSDVVASRTLPHKVPQGDPFATMMAATGLSSPQADINADDLMVSLILLEENVASSMAAGYESRPRVSE